MGLASNRKRLHPSNPVEWVDKHIARGKTIMCVTASVCFMRLVYKNVNTLVIATEIVRLVGMGCLVHRIGKEETCAGVSMKSQMITAMYLFVRLYCSSVMKQNVHVFADFFALILTLWVLCKIQFKLRPTYCKEVDHFPLTYLVPPCSLLSLIVCPRTAYPAVHRMLWAFSVYLETVQVLPQLNLMQAIRIIDPDTAHYVFALGVSRLLNCIHYVIRMVEGNKYILKIIGPGVWGGVTLACQMVSIFMLGDFSYYYIKSVMDGQRVVQLPI